MAIIQNFEQMTAHLATLGRRLRIAIVCGCDESTLYAVARVMESKFADILFVGETERIREDERIKASLDSFTFIEAEDGVDASRKAVALVREGKADILMKGLVNTDVLLRAVLDKETGVLPRGTVLTHLAVAQLANHPKLLFFTDAAVIPYPTQEQRMAQVDYAVKVCRAFGVETPRVSLLHCSEKVSDKFPHTLGYQDIVEEGKKGTFGEVIIDGPLDLRTSVDPVALHKKGIPSPLEGQADILVFPDIEAANMFYKTITYFCEAEVAGMLQGAACPVVLPSRGDSGDNKYFSLAFAAMAVK